MEQKDGDYYEMMERWEEEATFSGKGYTYKCSLLSDWSSLSS